MLVRHAVVGSALGLHARTAARFAQAVKDSGLWVEISAEPGGNAEADSILDVMSLNVAHGQEVELITDDDEEAGADVGEIARKMDALAALLGTDLDAEDGGEEVF